MRLTKYTHACVRLDVEGARLLIDPGTFTAESAAELAVVDAGRGSNAVFLGVDRTGAEFRRLDPSESLEI